MRVTLHGMIQKVVGNVQNRFESLAEIQRQLSTGLKVEKASDNPAASAVMMELQSTMRRNEQFMRNINYSIIFLETTESALSEIRDSLVSVRANAVKGANDAISSADRIAMAQQIDTGIRQVFHNVNQRHLGRFLFGGSKTDGQPYAAEEGEDGWLEDISPQYDTPLKAVEHIVSDGQRVKISVTGDNLLNLGEGETMFGMLTELRQAFAADDSEAIANMLDRIDTALDQINSLIGMVGARTSNLMTLKDRMDMDKLTITERYSQLADVDIIDAVTRFQEEQNAYEMALRTAASVIQPSLVNFIDL